MKHKIYNKPLLIDEKFFTKVKKKKSEFNNNNIKNDTFNCINNFFINNLGILFLASILTLLLYQRYLDVQIKKNNKNLYNEIVNEN